VTAKNAVVATAQGRGRTSGSTPPDVPILAVNQYASLPNKSVAL